jgi:hypothetical protein
MPSYSTAARYSAVCCSHGTDLLAEARRRQGEGHRFSGVVYAHQLQVRLGQCVRDLELIATIGEPDDFARHVYYLPLR